MYAQIINRANSERESSALFRSLDMFSRSHSLRCQLRNCCGCANSLLSDDVAFLRCWVHAFKIVEYYASHAGEVSSL
jgi:hypothetical protein